MLFRKPERNCLTADEPECPPIARRGATDRRTRPSHQSICWSSAGIRANRRLCRSANPNETAVPRIHANVRRSPGATRRIVVPDHPIKVCADHPRAFAPIGGEAVRRTPERNCLYRGSTRMSADRPARRDGSSYTTIPSTYVLVIRRHSRPSAVMLFLEPKRNCFPADPRECPPIARRDATDRRTRPSHQSICWSSAGIRANRRLCCSTNS